MRLAIIFLFLLHVFHELLEQNSCVTLKMIPDVCNSDVRDGFIGQLITNVETLQY